ncbi:chymotrypsinogen 2-like [Spodoptera frugiperda]|uniref:Chymotrypsinogen 2-like n=1 Tax=Spodoptera frugiperda TaxID=7108 RepID=A0A9R0DEU2_SPOFR|nr:chymotrypsinogen 2-like [Spodoptera frugiperda]
MTFQIISFQFSNRYFMFLKCLFGIVLYLTESFAQNELAINSVNETSAVISGPNKEVWFPRVINGIPAKLGDVPYQVSLKKLMKDGFYMTFCGGAIISEKKVLSAAHCFVENVQRNVSLEGFIDNMLLMDKCAVAGCLLNKVNHTNDNDQAQWRKLAGVRYPKNFSFPNYDIAVVYLCTPFIYTDYVAPIPIASKEMDYNGTCLASGYGRTSHTEKDAISNILLLAHLELDKRAACSISQLGDNDSFVCINIQGSDVAKGDSGGPLVCKNTGDPNEKENGVLVGVVSGHIRERGSFFSRVSKYYDFVTDDPALDSFSNIPSYTSLHSSSPSYSLDTFNSITIVIIYNIFLF